MPSFMERFFSNLTGAQRLLAFILVVAVSVTLDRYRECNGDFVLVLAGWSSCLDSNGRNELVEIVNDALVQAVELALPLVLQAGVSGGGAQQPCGKWGIDAFEEFEKYQADGIAAGEQAVSSGVG